MSPEQAQGQTDLVDERSDIYALGAILYFLLTGRPPVALVDAPGSSRSASPVLPRQINLKVPRAIEAICMKAMSESREHRFSSAEEIAGDVVRFLDGEPVSAYRENLIEKTGRWVNKYRFIVVLIAAYLIMRLIVFFAAGR